MATDKEFRDLEAVVATLRRDLRESQDTINLWRQNGLGHLDSGSGKWRYGGNTMQLDRHGIQIVAPIETPGIFWVETISVDPGNLSTRASIAGSASATETNLSLLALNGGSGPSVGLFGDSTFHQVSINTALVLGSAITPSTIASTQNDYAPTNLHKATVLRLASDASRDITGLEARNNAIKVIFNVGSFDIVLKDEDAGSTDANRFALNGDITLAPDTGAVLWYDTITERWRCAGRYSAGGGAGDVATDTLWNALGDLAVGTGPNTASILTVGTDDSILMADSGTASGLKWAGAATTAEIADVTTGVEAAGTSDTYARGDHVHHGDFAPSTVDYLVGTATGDLSAEIVVGTSPGGELGGTWASPTVDATHSGSAHADYIAKSLVDAKGDILTATADNTPARLAVGMDGYVLTADALESTGIKWAAATGSGDVATDTIWDAIGDLAVGSGANTASVLTVGPDDYVLTADSGEPLGVKWAPAAGGSGDTTSIARTLLLVGA